MSTILITEKPSVARTYAEVLGVSTKNEGYIEGYSDFLKDDVKITWAVGHLVELGSPDEQRAGKLVAKKDQAKWSKADLPIYPTKWFYKTKYETLDQFKVIKSLYKAPDTTRIYYAGDSGREGIYIQALIRNMVFGDGSINGAKVPTSVDEKVIWIDSYTDDSIKNGIRSAKPYSDYSNMISSAYLRGIIDWLYGMNFTEGYTLKANTLVNIGRVMTPTLHLICERQREIDNFVVEDYFGINSAEGFKWKADKNSVFFESPLLFNEFGFKKEPPAKQLKDELSQDNRLTVEDVKITIKTELPPLFFNLADIQAFCSKKYHISPAQTLSYIQTLYEQKYVTYPRTDARVISTAVATELKQHYGYNIPARYIDDSKITDHYAIIPTFEHRNAPDGIIGDIYNDIYLRFMATMEEPYKYNSYSIVCVHSNKEHFYGSQKKTIQLGWKRLYNDQPQEENFVEYQKGQILNTSFDINKMQTTPPKAYTTGSLILTMEKAGKFIEDEELRDQIKTCGIGTSATRANIIEKLKAKQYIKIDRSQKISAEPLGLAIDEIVYQIDKTITSPEKTAEMEQKLSDVVDGKESIASIYSDSKAYINEILALIDRSDIQNNQKLKEFSPSKTKNNQVSGLKCPCCGEALAPGKFGLWCPTNKDFKSYGGHKYTKTDVDALNTKGRTKKYHLKFQSGKEGDAAFVLNNDTHEIDLEFGGR